MSDSTEKQPKPPLSPTDLEILEKFLDAWCQENGVDRADATAEEIASSLIAWYQADAKRWSLEHFGETAEPAIPPEIEELLRKIT